MGRSLYGALHRRYGRRAQGAEHKRRADLHQERLRSVMPTGLLTAPLRTGASPGRVAVVGAGFAGSLAAYTLQRLGFEVSLFDGGMGGRVSTSAVANRLLETGGELIGSNHPLWMLLSNSLDLGMSVVTSDDNFAAEGLEMPLVLESETLDATQQAALYAEMTEVFTDWCKAARRVENPWVPWTTPHAGTLDAESLGDHMHGARPLLRDLINKTFVFNNLQTLEAQSWLANLAQFAAGMTPQGGPDDLTGFFDDTELYRCASGNQSLQRGLLSGHDVHRANVTDLDTTSGKVVLTLAGGETAGPFDYCVFAAPVTVYSTTTVDGGSRFPWEAIQAGYACKYLAPLDRRFWLTEGVSPSGMSDRAGMTWEATDNQVALPGQTGAQYCLTLFTGGPIAQKAVDDARKTNDPAWADAYFRPLIEQMYPGFQPAGSGGTFCCGSGGTAPYLMSGYSCPAPGQVTTIQRSYASPHNGMVFLAGEHVSPAWFGFMEGALESGFAAAVRVALAAGVDIPQSNGGLGGIVPQG